MVDFTHVPTRSGFCYTAFVMDLFSRRIVGWATGSRMNTDFVLGALEQAIQARKDRGGGDLEGLVHHSDHGSKSPVHRLHRTTRRRGHRGIRRSRGFLLRRRRRRGPGQVLQARGPFWRDGPWRDRDDLETATARWVNWYNRTRPHLTNDDDLSPAAAEHRYHRNHTTTAAPPATA